MEKLVWKRNVANSTVPASTFTTTRAARRSNTGPSATPASERSRAASCNIQNQKKFWEIARKRRAGQRG